MCTGHHLFTRSIVWFAALVIVIFASVDLSECHGRVYCFVLNIAILVIALFGVVGAWRNDKSLLGWFLLLIFCMIGMEVSSDTQSRCVDCNCRSRCLPLLCHADRSSAVVLSSLVVTRSVSSSGHSWRITACAPYCGISSSPVCSSFSPDSRHICGGVHMDRVTRIRDCRRKARERRCLID
jgi:hypothetical protein